MGPRGAPSDRPDGQFGQQKLKKYNCDDCGKLFLETELFEDGDTDYWYCNGCWEKFDGKTQLAFTSKTEMDQAEKPPKAKWQKKDHHDDETVQPPSSAPGEHLQGARASSTAWKSRTTTTTKAFLTDQKFTDLQPKLNSLSLKAIDKMGFSFMTQVQAESLPPIMEHKDVFAKAKTGTGKTIGFLLPTIEKIWQARANANSAAAKKDQGRISALVLSPTRELAMQISEEANALTQFWSDFASVLMFGGRDIKKDKQQLEKTAGRDNKTYRTIDLLVATPGRLYDHLQQNTAMIYERLMQGQHSAFTLILDEADQLLEMGFRDAIVKIVDYLPKNRQSLLFSATLSNQIKEVLQLVLKKDYTFVDTCKNESAPAAIHQRFFTCGAWDILEVCFSMLFRIWFSKGKEPTAKVICFLPTARQTQFFAEVANSLFSEFKRNSPKGIYVPQTYEIHSRKSQAQRTKTSDAFREADTGILFSSDVSARGLDYPNVTHVLQIGAPASLEQYTHRMGRTARAGEMGESVLLLCDFEKDVLGRDFVKRFAEQDRVHLPTVRKFGREGENSTSWNMGTTTTSSYGQISQPTWKALFQASSDPDVFDKSNVLSVADIMAKNQVFQLLLGGDTTTDAEGKTKDQCYAAWLGYYNGLCPKRISWSKEKLVEQANLYAERVLYCDEQPTLMKKTVGMMGLKGVPGLRIEGGGGGGGQKGGGKKNGGKQEKSSKNQKGSSSGPQQSSSTSFPESENKRRNGKGGGKKGGKGGKGKGKNASS
ncbi:unnamed protein product [Amoebophrya sp. A120]|nr:unnamed protein product [Amoebophrya sp. A120]|eukprot:GSA120T00022714001.1